VEIQEKAKMILFEGKGLTQLSFDDVVSEINSRELTEGLYIDWKADIPNALGKYVASFANTRGGYIFIGIKEDPATKKADKFDGISILQNPLDKVRNLIKDTISPVPYFENALIKESEESKTGILILYIPESATTPHIYKNGKIYVRQAEGSDPLDEIKDRFSLDQLYQKRDANKEKLKARLNQTIYHSYYKSYFLNEKFETHISTNIISYPSISQISNSTIPKPEEFRVFLAYDCFPCRGNRRFVQNGLAMINDPDYYARETGYWWKSSEYSIIYDDWICEYSQQRDISREKKMPMGALLGDCIIFCRQIGKLYSELNSVDKFIVEFNFLGTQEKIFLLEDDCHETFECHQNVIKIEKEISNPFTSEMENDLKESICDELSRAAGIVP